MDKKTPMFPILGDPIIKAIPWSVLSPHEKQAFSNHSQSLSRLASRGGLGIDEAYCVIKGMRVPIGGFQSEAKVRIALMRLIHNAELENAANATSGDTP